MVCLCRHSLATEQLYSGLLHNCTLDVRMYRDRHGVHIRFAFCCHAALYKTSKGAQLRCKPGHGSSTGTPPCDLCPAGTFSVGNTMDDCTPCPADHTSFPGADSKDDCVALSVTCPDGQTALPGAKSPEDCGCKPGYGGEVAGWLVMKCCSSHCGLLHASAFLPLWDAIGCISEQHQTTPDFWLQLNHTK